MHYMSVMKLSLVQQVSLTPVSLRTVQCERRGIIDRTEEVVVENRFWALGSCLFPC
jgi:hypothetical protein